MGQHRDHAMTSEIQDTLYKQLWLQETWIPKQEAFFKLAKERSTVKQSKPATETETSESEVNVATTDPIHTDNVECKNSFPSST